MSSGSRVVGLLLALGTAVTLGCGEGEEECVPPTGELSADASADELAGSYELIMVATQGRAAGDTAEGSLSLEPFRRGEGPPARENFRMPLYGTMDLDLSLLGARVPGDVGSNDPAMPGVLVIESTLGPPRMMLRLGSDANRFDRQPFEAEYAILEIREVGDDGFRGTWRSGLADTEAAGHFCAER